VLLGTFPARAQFLEGFTRAPGNSIEGRIKKRLRGYNKRKLGFDSVLVLAFRERGLLGIKGGEN